MVKLATCHLLTVLLLLLCGMMVVLAGKPNNTPANDPSLINRINSKSLGWKAKAHKIFAGKTLGDLKKLFRVDSSVMEHFRDVLDKINQKAKENEVNDSSKVSNNNNGQSETSNTNNKKVKSRNTKGKKSNAASGNNKKTRAPKTTSKKNRNSSTVKNSTRKSSQTKKSATKKTSTTTKRRTLRVSSGGVATLAKKGKSATSSSTSSSSSSSASSGSSSSSIPASFDARDRWPNCPPRINQQFECGSCYAFTATGALAHRFCVASRGGVYPNLAPDYLVRCNTVTKACNGGKTVPTWEFLERTGVPTSECVMYRSGYWNVQACPEVCDDGATPLKMYKTKPGSFKQLMTDADIKRSIMNEGSVHTIMVLLRDFLSYEEGIYTMKSDTVVGAHAVQLIGWGEEDGTAFWWGVNSWGEGWGLRGFFKIKMGEVGIGRQTHAALPQL